MRIAHVSDFRLPRLGGIEVHVAALSDHQRAAGHDVDILSALDGSEAPFARLRPATLRATCDAVRRGGYDVVHVHAGVFTPIAFSAAVAASRVGIPTAVTMHSLVTRARPAMHALDAVTHWSRLPVAWNAVSAVAADPLRRLLGRDTPVGVLPNAVDPEAWRVDPAPRDPDHIVIVAVNRLTARKRPLPLLRALQRARAQVPPSIRVSAVIVGDGPQRRACERVIDGRMRDWVHLTGPLSQAAIRDLYRRADVFVAPARYESFGIAALEARTAGIPVVAMARAGVSTFIEDRTEGLLVEGDDELAAALATLTTDASLRAAIASHNQACVPTFNWNETLAIAEREYGRAAAMLGGTVPNRRAELAIARGTTIR